MEKLKKSLKDAIFKHEIDKVKYKTHNLIVDGHQKQLYEMLGFNKTLKNNVDLAEKDIERIRELINEELKKTSNEKEKFS